MPSILATLPPATPTSARKRGMPVPSMTVPPRMRVSKWVTAVLSGQHVEDVRSVLRARERDDPVPVVAPQLLRGVAVARLDVLEQLGVDLEHPLPHPRVLAPGPGDGAGVALVDVVQHVQEGAEGVVARLLDE